MKERVRELVEAQLEEGWSIASVDARGRTATVDLNTPAGPLQLVLRPLPAPDALAEGSELAVVSTGWSPTDKAQPLELRRRALLICKALLDAESELAHLDARPPPTRRSGHWLWGAAAAAGLAAFQPLEWLTPLLWAAGVGTAYVVLSAWLGEVFPFSRYAAYARTANRTEGSALVVLADGVEARLSDFDGFAGFDLQELRRLGNRSSQAWELHEVERWLTEHAGDGGEVGVEIVVHRYVAGARGFNHEATVAASGRARRRA